MGTHPIFESDFDCLTDMKLSPLIATLAYAQTEEGPTYQSPERPESVIFFETFDHSNALDSWSQSNSDKYSGGKWSIEELAQGGLSGDMGLVLKEKAKHHALVTNTELFQFNRDLTIQYEVAFQTGIECGGAYMKLLTESDDDLSDFNDSTPFTIMFGPDKCGADYKYHFIFRYKNPITGEFQEHSPTKKIETAELDKKYKDNKPHLFTLKLKTDNSYEMLIDNKSVSSGSLLSDMNPPIMPKKEIPDPEDSKPGEWDERERIPDPADSKPDDWDETAPAKIPDASATMPSGWLEDEPAMVNDPNSVMPDDWDEDMDGEWEAPLIENEVCASAAGCGPWEPPMINNPDYKGKWKPKMMANPDYKGKWAPRNIPNPDYFEDLTPFKSLKPFDSIGFELWTLSSDIYFDNIIITFDDSQATDLYYKTTQTRKKSSSGMFDGLVEATEGRPWLWAVYILSVVIPITLLIMCLCCGGGSKADDEYAQKKKTDEPTPDDPHSSEESEDTDEEQLPEENQEQPPNLENEEADSKTTEKADEPKATEEAGDGDN